MAGPGVHEVPLHPRLGAAPDGDVAAAVVVVVEREEDLSAREESGLAVGQLLACSRKSEGDLPDAGDQGRRFRRRFPSNGCGHFGSLSHGHARAASSSATWIKRATTGQAILVSAGRPKMKHALIGALTLTWRRWHWVRQTSPTRTRTRTRRRTSTTRRMRPTSSTASTPMSADAQVFRDPRPRKVPARAGQEEQWLPAA